MINSASSSQPTLNSILSNDGKKSRKRENEAFQCHLCGTMIKAYNFDYYKRSNHAIIHTNLQRYICPIKSCGTKTRHRSNMVVHARTAHGFIGKVDVQNCLLPHEDEELKQTVVNCFPEMEATVKNMMEREKKKNLNGFEEEEQGNESDEDCLE
uniref:C2H2-type domain-containing protein n=1 Tax=Caenorhabditis tropicalis TaxID=1561998 RepID=A0A1I7UL35_9PELO